MDYLAEFGRRGFEGTESLPTLGLVEFSSDLFPGDATELGLEVYAPDRTVLEQRVQPVLEDALAQLDSLAGGLGDLDADLTKVVLWGERLGLHFWSRGTNNEFTAVFVRDPLWRFIGYGDVLDGPGPV